MSPNDRSSSSSSSSSSPAALAKSKISSEVPNAYSVKEGILARQKRIQELFAGRNSAGELPEVGKFTKAELRRLQHEQTHKPLKKVQWAEHLEEDLTEDCTDNLDDSFADSLVVVTQEPEAWGKYAHGIPEEEEEEEPTPSVPTDEEIAIQERRQMRKTVHKELICTFKECVKIQEEHDEKRKEKYGKNVAILTEAPLDERTEKRKVRLQQAKERIQREQEQQVLQLLKKQSKYPVVERRQKAYETYLHFGMPSKKKFLERVTAAAATAQTKNTNDLSPEEVELLPWLDGGLTVDVSALARLQRRDELAQQ